MAETEQVQVTFTDDDSASAIAAKLVSALDAAFSRATNRLGDRLEKPFQEMAKAAQREGRKTSKIFDDIDEKIRQATKSGNAFKTTFDGIRNTTARSGSFLDPRVFDASERSFNHLEESIERIKRDFAGLASTSGGRQVLGNLTAAVRSSANQANVAQQSVSRTAAIAEKARADAARVAQQRITALEVRGSKERVVAAQQEGAQTLAAMRASSRERVALIQSIARNLTTLQTSMTRIAVAGARSFNTALGTIGRGLGAVLSRSNREMTSGLQGAVNQRTTILQRAFSRQESVVRNSVNNQSRVLNNFERQLSTGVLGAASGRSATAGALGIGGGILAGAGIARVLRDGLMAGADFTAGLAVLDAQLQLTDEQMASVRKTALDLGNDITLPGVSALDAAQAIQQLAKQFGDLGTLAPAAATAAAKGVLQLSRATQASSEDAAQVVGAAVNVFGIEASRATEVADQVASALSKAAGTGFGEFSQAFKQGATVFAQFQVPALGATDALLEFNTALATLAQGGLIGSDAGTSLRSFFLQANRGTDDANQILRELSLRAGETGTAFFTAEGKSRKLGDTLEILRKGLEGFSDQERSDRLFTLFGSDAIRAAEILTQTTGPAFDATREALRRQGVAAELAAAQNQGLRGAMDALGSTIETQLILAYEKFQIAAGNAVLVAANFFNNLASGEGIFAAIRQGLKGVGIALGGLLGIKVIAEGFGLLRVALAAVLTPMGLFITAAAAIGAAIAILYKNSARVRAIFDEVRTAFEAFVFVFQSNADLRGSDDGLVGFFIDLGYHARQVFNFIGDELIPRVREFGRTLVENFTGVLTGSGKDDEIISAMFGFDSRNIGEKIGDRIRQLVGPVTEAVQSAFAFVRDALRGSGRDDDLVSAMFGFDDRTAGEKFGDRVREVVDTAVSTIRSIVTPVREAISGILFGSDETDVAELLLGRDTRTNFEKIGDGIRTVLTPLRSFTDALKDLADVNPGKGLLALGGIIASVVAGFAVAGPVGATIAGLGATVGALFYTGIADELGSSLAGVGDLIVSALAPLGNTIKSTLGRVLSVDNIIDVGLFATELAQRLGRTLGNVLSDPRLVAGVAGFAGFAALAAGRFILGFGQGVLSNVPELASMFGDALEAALRAALGALTSLDAGTFATVLAGVFIGRQALSVFRRSGVVAGTQVQEGFRQAFARQSFGGIFAGGGAALGRGGAGSFLTGLFGGAGGISRRIELEMAKANSTALRETTRLNNTLALAGRRVNLGSVPAGGFADAVRQQYGQLVNDVGPSGILGLRLRAGVQAGISSLRNLSVAPFRQFLNDMGTTGFAMAKQIGAKLATGIAGGLAGIQVGQAVAGQGLLTQVSAIGGTALAIGAISPAAGIAAAALGTLTAAISSSGSSAEEAKAQIKGYQDAIRGIDPSELSTALGSRVTEALIEQGPEVLRILNQAGFNAQEFGKRLASGSRGARAEQLRLLESLQLTGGALEQAVLRAPITSQNAGNLARAARTEVQGLGLDYKALVDALILVGDEGNAAFKAIEADALVRGLTEVTSAAEGASPAVQSLIDNFLVFGTLSSVGTQLATQATEAAARDAAIAFQDAQRDAEDFLNGSYGDSLQKSIDDLFLSGRSIDSSIAGLEGLSGAVRDAALRQIGNDVSIDIRAVVSAGLETGEITNPTQYLNDLKGQVQTQVDAGALSADAGFVINTQIDQILADPNFAAQISGFLTTLASSQEATTVSPTLSLDPQVEISEEAKGRIGNDIAAALGQLNSGGGQFGMSRGVGGGGGSTLSVDLELDPDISLSANAAVAASAVGVDLANAIAAGFTSGQGSITSAAAGAAALGALSALSTLGTYSAAGSALARSFAAGIAAGRGAAVGAATALGAAASNAVRANTSAAFSAGTQIAAGLAAGIRAGTAAAVGAARAMASAVAAATRAALLIQSPSLVFADIGMNIGRGMAQGIADSEGEIAGAARSAVDAAVGAATSRVDEIAAASSQLFGILRPGGSNGVSNTDLTRQRIGLNSLGTQLQSIFENSAKTLWDAVVATGEGTGDAIQRNINHQFAYFGQNFGAGSQASLDPSFVLGSQNVSGFLDLGEKIRDFVETAVASGADLGSVIEEARSYRDQLVLTATYYNANSDAINGLLDQLGLSDSALGQFRQQVEQLRNEALQVREPTPDKAAEEREREEAQREADRAREEAEDAAHEAEVAALKEQLRRQAIDARPIEVTVVPPYGDPEAIGLGVVNRLVYELGR